MAARGGRAAIGLVLASVVLAGGAVPASARAPYATSTARERLVPILMYHHLSPAPPGARNPRLWVSARRFRQHLNALARAGYRAVTLERVWRAWRYGEPLPAKPVVLSFDDGYLSHHHGARALRARAWPGVLFLQVGRLGGVGGLSVAQVREMIDDGWELGAHTYTHPDLTAVDAARLEHEVAGSRQALRRQFGVAVDAFAYPSGRLDATVETAVAAAGFSVAVTIRPGLASPHDDPYRLDRLLVDGSLTGRELVARLRERAATSRS